MENRKFKKTYVTVIWIITLVAVLIGLWIHTGGWFSFGFRNFGKDVEDSVTFDSADADSIDLDIDAGTVTFESGSQFKVDYIYPEKIVPEISNENGTIRVYQHIEGWSSKSLKGKHNITITVPEKELEKLNIEMDLGDLNISDVSAKKVTVDCSLGDVNIKNSKGDRISADDSLGEIHMKNCEFAEIETKADYGDVNIQNCKGERISANGSLGEIGMIGCEFAEIEAKADLGDIDIDAEFDSIDANCDLGDIDIKTKKDIDDLKVKLTCDLGEIKVNGKKW